MGNRNLAFKLHVLHQGSNFQVEVYLSSFSVVSVLWLHGTLLSTLARLIARDPVAFYVNSTCHSSKRRENCSVGCPDV